jgi:glutamate carboxypeptidase
VYGVAEMGGSDGSFVAATGVPTLDGLGPVARHQCSSREVVEVSSIVPRTALLAGLIAGARAIVGTHLPDPAPSCQDRCNNYYDS